MEEDDFIDVELTRDQSFDPDVLVPSSARTFGGEEADLNFHSILLRIGRKPVARNIRKLYEKSGRVIPEGLEIFESYDLWLLSNSFGILNRGGFRHVQQVGFHIRLPESPRCSVLSIFPKTEFVKLGGIKLEMEAEIGVNGRLSVPKVALDPVLSLEELSGGGKLALSSEASVVARVSLSLISTAIQAIGAGDNESQWVFERMLGGEPLLGDQMVMQVILTPRRLRKLTVTASVFANVATCGVLSTKLSGAELTLDVTLA